MRYIKRTVLTSAIALVLAAQERAQPPRQNGMGR